MNRKLLKQVEFWHKSIALQLVQECSKVSPSELDTITRRIVLAVLWLVLCEQRGVTGTQPFFQRGQQGDRLYLQLLTEVQQVGNQLGQLFPLTLPSDLPVRDNLLGGFVDSLHSDSSAGLADHLLAQVYEQSLGWSLQCGSGGQIGPAANTLHKGVSSKGVSYKKVSGIYYTPEAIVHYVIEQTIDALLPDNEPPDRALRIVDPACGGGAFLLAAYQRLLDWQRRLYLAAGDNHPGLQRGTDGQWQLTQAERSRILQAHLYGVDLDSEAVAVTQLSLWLKLLEDLPCPLKYPLPDLSRNIRWGNAVMSLTDGFEWKTAFAEILQTGGFDAVVGNPPYIDSEWMSVHLPQCRQYCAQHYRAARGNWDLFCVFVEKAIDLCRPGGLVSLVVPNKLASADYARTARQILGQENQMLTIRDYAQVPVFAASVYPLVFVAQKRSSQTNRGTVRYELMQDLYRVQQTRFIDLHSSPFQQGWRLTTTHPQSSLLARLQQDFPTLSDIAQVQGAATVAEAYQIQSLIQNLPILASGDLQVVNSGTIDRYRLLWGKKPLRYLGQSYQHPGITKARCTDLPAKRYQQAQQSKIIVAGMTQRLECAFDPIGAVLAGKSTSIIWVEGSAIGSGAVDPRYLLGLLNSSLLSFYFSHSFHGNRLQGGYFRVGPPQLRSLPICLPNLDRVSDRKDYEQMIEWVEQMSVDQSQIEPAIDQLVYKLYRLTDAETHECGNGSGS